VNALDQVRALFEYNAWADGHVLDAASQLDDEGFARELGASFGSVHGNLVHALGAQGIWWSRWAGEKVPALPKPDLASVRAACDTSHERLLRFARSLNGEDLDRVLSYVDTRGEPQKRVLGQTMIHLVNHGTHHRAETALLLTALNKPPRQLDYVFFEIERAGGKPRLT
jgi:uncharacterized damage-inducible protein DinB